MTKFNIVNNKPDANRTQNAISVFGASGALTDGGPLTNGQLLIGNTGNPPSAATLTAGAGITVTNAAGSVTITNNGATSGSGIVNRQVFTSNGTYTPTSGMMFCDIEVVGGGGGGGGSAASPTAAGGAGGGGGYARKIFTAATIGASQSVTVGAGGTGGIAGGAGPNDGGTGGTTSVGALISATGGAGGKQAGSFDGGSAFALGGLGGTGSSGDFNTKGDPGDFGNGSGSYYLAGKGGSSFFGGGAISQVSNVDANGFNAVSYGGGGGGAIFFNTTPKAGGTGGGGIVIVTEYISVTGGPDFVYEEITAATKTIVVGFEYGANRGGGVAFTLPTSATAGTRFRITGISGLWSISQNANQFIHFGSSTTTVGVGGSLTATNASDSITLTCTTTDLGWTATDSIGNLTVV